MKKTKRRSLINNKIFKNKNLEKQKTSILTHLLEIVTYAYQSIFYLYSI